MNAFTHFALATAYLLLFYVKHNSFSLVMKQALTVGHHRQFFQIGALHTSYCRPSCKWLSSGHICYRTFICTGSVSTFFVCTIPTSSLQPPNILNVCLSSALSRRGYHRHDNIQLTPYYSIASRIRIHHSLKSSRLPLNHPIRLRNNQPSSLISDRNEHP